MRTIVLLAAVALVVGFASLAPAAQARDLACTDLAQPTCDGLVCADANLDGRYQWNECEPRYCTCDPEPEPW